MSTPEVIEDILEHHGTKGMRWGVTRSSRAVSLNTRNPAKYQKKLTKKINSPQTKMQLEKAVVPSMVNHHIPRINQKYSKEIMSGQLSDRNSSATKRYNKDLADAYASEVNKQLKFMTDPTGTKTYHAESVITPGRKRDHISYKITASDIKHADNSEEILIHVKIIKDSNGVATGFEVVDDASVAQSAIDDILTHHGVKGQKWGVRRKATVGAQEVVVSDKRKKLKTSGGQGHPAHADAVRARTSGQVGKKSGLKALSNDELTAYNKRLNLEQQTKRLMYEDSSPPKKFVLSLLRQTGKTQAHEAANQLASKQVKKVLIKAGTAAAVAA